jgi:hypothetical protein
MDSDVTNHSCQGADNCSTTSQQHSCDENIGHDAEDSEDQMSTGSEASLDDFKEGMGIWCSSLELDGDTREEQDLDSGTRSVPKRTTDSVVVSYGGTLQQSSSPLHSPNDEFQI